MTTQFKEWGWNEADVIRFISKIEKALPHMPGNWNFISVMEKLRFIYNNKEGIYTSIEKYAPVPKYNSVFDSPMFADREDNEEEKKYREYFAVRTSLTSLLLDDED